jgi:hypothetical protein
LWKEGNAPPISAQSAKPPVESGFLHGWLRGRGPLVPWLRRSADRLRPLDEAAAYARCHGSRDESVRIVHLPPRRRRYDDLLATGEEIRRRFEELIDAREVEQPL